MKIENIIKNLTKDNIKVYKGQFDFKDCFMVNGTALIDLEDGIVKDTTARYMDVLKQVQSNRSHIYTIVDNKKELSLNYRLGYK